MPPEQKDFRRFSLFAKPLQSFVEPLLRPVFKQQGTAASRIITQWPIIVGEAMAAYSAPVKLSFARQKNNDGTLTVSCEGAHALALQHMTPLIIDRISSYFGYRAVSRIAIEQCRIRKQQSVSPVAPPPKKPVDVSCLSQVEDDDLKNALCGLAEQLSNRPQ